MCLSNNSTCYEAFLDLRVQYMFRRAKLRWFSIQSIWSTNNGHSRVTCINIEVKHKHQCKSNMLLYVLTRSKQNTLVTKCLVTLRLSPTIKSFKHKENPSKNFNTYSGYLVGVTDFQK